MKRFGAPSQKSGILSHDICQEKLTETTDDHKPLFNKTLAKRRHTSYARFVDILQKLARKTRVSRDFVAQASSL
jgi:hypothetical protein